MLIYKGTVLGFKKVFFFNLHLKKIQSRPRSKISKTPGKCFNNRLLSFRSWEKELRGPRQGTETKVSASGDEMEKWRGNRCWVFVFITWRVFSTYSAWGERSVRIGIDCMLWWENMFIRILSQWDQDDGLTLVGAS